MPLDLTPHNERVAMLRSHWQTGRIFALLLDQTCEWMEGYAELIAEFTAARALLTDALTALELQPKPEAKWDRDAARQRADAKRAIRRYLREEAS